MLRNKKTWNIVIGLSLLLCTLLPARFVEASAVTTITDPTSFCKQVLSGDWQIGGNFSDKGECLTGTRCRVDEANGRATIHGCDSSTYDELINQEPGPVIALLDASKGLPDDTITKLSTYQPPYNALPSGDFKADCDKQTLTKDNCGIIYYIITFTNVLSALVGIIVAIVIAVGGIQYAASHDNPQQAADAKGRIRNGVIALVLYIFIFAFVQWIVPGGVF